MAHWFDEVHGKRRGDHRQIRIATTIEWSVVFKNVENVAVAGTAIKWSVGFKNVGNIAVTGSGRAIDNCIALLVVFGGEMCDAGPH